MDKEVLFCGYSYHTKRFNQTGVDSYLFRLQMIGTCVIEAEGQFMLIEPGDLILLKPGSSYELRVEEIDSVHRTKTGSPFLSADYYLFCQGSWIDEWWNRSEKPLLTRIELDETLISLWKMIISEKCRAQGESQEFSSYLLHALCIQIERAIQENHSNYNRPFTASRMKRYIEDHAKQKFKVEDVANQVGLSVSRAIHLFKQCFDKTMIEYLMEIRLSEAVELMKYSTSPLQQIAQNCGFGSYTYFHRVFKKKYGLSPAVFRNQITNTPPKS